MDTPLNIPSLRELRYAMIATAAYVFLYYAYMILQVQAKHRTRAKIKAILRKNGAPKLKRGELAIRVQNDPDYMRHQRTFLNMLEQMPVFLVSFLVYTLVVDAEMGGKLALAYTFFRALYAPLYPMTMLKVALSTTPNYLIIWYMAGAVGLKGLSLM